MFKFHTILLMFAFVMIVAGCSDYQEHVDAEPRKTKEKPVYKSEMEVPVGDFTYFTKRPKETKELSNAVGIKKTEGNFVLIDVTVTNNDITTRMVDTALFTLKDGKGRKYEPNHWAELYVNSETFFMTDLSPNMSKTTTIVFEVPLDAYELVLEVSSGVGLAGGQTENIVLEW
jgi:hypothetical protein